MGAAKKVRATKLHIYRKVDGDKLVVGITDRPDDGDMYLLGYLSASRQPCSRCLMQTNALARRNKVHRVMDWPYEVNGASLDESLHNRGLGAWMYAELARMAWASRRAPIAMSECCRGYTTSLAKRAWASKSLAKSVDVEGDVVGLWRDRTKTGLATPPPAPPGFVLLDAMKPQRPARAVRQRNPTGFHFDEVTREWVDGGPKKAVARKRGSTAGHYFFVMDCTESTYEDIQALMASESEVSRPTVVRAIGSEQWRAWQRKMGYDKDFPISRDWHVGYYKGVFRGVPAYFIRHSRIEHIFTLGGEVGASLSTDRRRW
jgi:hypothetical protein